MYRIAICDDDPDFVASFRTWLQKALAENGVGYELSAFSKTNDLMAKLGEADAFDLIFLDIIFRHDNGIEVAGRIRKTNPRIDIVLITVEAGYALPGYDVAPLHFLVKPITPEKLDIALKRFLTKHETDRLLIRIKGASLSISTNDIEYIEIFSHDILIHTVSGEPVSYSGTLTELQSVLPARGFVRCHRSYIINLRYVSGISRYQVMLLNNRTLAIGKSRYGQIQSDLVAYTRDKLADY